MGFGQGKGYRNIIGRDPSVHSQSAQGIKQPQKSPILNFFHIKTKKEKLYDELEKPTVDFIEKNFGEIVSYKELDSQEEGEVYRIVTQKRIGNQIQYREFRLFLDDDAINDFFLYNLYDIIPDYDETKELLKKYSDMGKFKEENNKDYNSYPIESLLDYANLQDENGINFIKKLRAKYGDIRLINDLKNSSIINNKPISLPDGEIMFEIEYDKDYGPNLEINL